MGTALIAVAALLCLASVGWAYVTLDLGRRWIAERAQRVREANERMDALEKRTANQLETFDRAVVIAAKSVAEIEDRVIDLESQNKTNEMATRGFSRRRAPTPE